MVSSEQAADFERQRQSQVMMTTYISSAIREKKQGNPLPFEELIAQLTVSKPAPLTPAKLLQWIQAMSQCISLLDKSCTALIDAMLQIDWVVQDDVFVQYYLSFLGNVVSAHAFYVVAVQSMLVKKLTTRHKSSSPEALLSVTRERQFERVHQALKYTLDLIPTGPTTLFPLLAAEFPHKRESIHAHVIYVKNILRVLDYAPVLRAQVLSVVIDRIIQIDVEIQVELEELEDSDTEVVYDFDMPDNADDDDQSDDDSVSDDGSGSDSDSDAAEVTVLNVKEMIKKLDGMLYLFSDYFLGALGQQILDKSQPQVVRVAAAAYMSSFVARAKYLDLRQVGMVVDMLGSFALETVEQVDTGSNVLPDAERYAVFYASVQALLYIFCFRWKVLVIGGGKSASNKDDFDSAGMIVGSMDETLGSHVEASAARQWHSGLSCLQRIVTSRLNPLKICSINVVKQFARLSNSLNFMYIYPILEQNKKVFIPRNYTAASSGTGAGGGGNNGSGQANGGVLPHELETFFPFDPYRLRQSAPFMNGIYQEWEDEEEGDDDEDDEDDEDYEEDYEGEEEDGEEDDLGFVGRRSAQVDNDDDDEEALVNKSIMAMSISPSPAHFLVQGILK
ncbi:hypothetical protein EDD11_006093 [Mortierella claussenii]|nr:hypothetical protein EDD11_006093 [Mortierella claussenii]